MIARRRAVAVAVVVASQAGLARAEETPPPPAAAEGSPVDVVVTGTRTPEQANRAAVRTDVVTREEAVRRGASNVGEALAGSLGLQVNASAYSAIGGPSAVQLGGFDRERVLVLEDGERVVGDVGGAVDLAQLSLADVSRIEVVQGPASSLYGTSAIGGVVNVISAPPRDEGWSGAAQLEGRHRLGALANGSTAYRQGNDWASVEASAYGSEGLRLRDELPDLALPLTQRYQLGVRGGTQIAPAAQLQARLRYGLEVADGLESQVLPGLPRFEIELPERTHRFSGRLRHLLELAEGHSLVLSTGSQWFYNESDRDRRASPVDEERTRFHNMRSIEATAGLFQGSFLSAVVGARAESEHFEQDLVRTVVNGTELERQELAEVEPVDISSGAGYGELRWDALEGLTLLGGARVEGNTRFGAVVAPRGGIAYRHDDWLVARASGGRGYRAPSGKELGFVFDHSVYGYRVVGNDELAPETSWGISGDVDVRPAGGLRLRALGFVNWIDDLIDLRLAPEQSGAGGVDDFTYVNVGSARTFGAQGDVSVALHERLRAEAGYAYLFTRDEDAQRPLPGRPPHTFLFALVGRLPWEMSFVTRWRFVTSAYLDDETRAPGFSTLDLRYGKDLWPGAEAYAGVQNLLGVQKDPDLTGDQRPVEGRTVYLGIRAQHPAW